MQYKNYIIWLILIILALGIFLKLQLKPKNNNYINNQQNFEYMRQANIKTFNESGSLTRYITASYWQFFPKQQISLVNNPNIIIYKDNNNYNIKSNNAKIIHDKLFNQINLIKLKTNVNVIKKNNNNWTNLSTDYLEFNPNTELAYTKKEVTITKPGVKLTALGMKANLKNNDLEFPNKVSTITNK